MESKLNNMQKTIAPLIKFFHSWFIFRLHKRIGPQVNIRIRALDIIESVHQSSLRMKDGNQIRILLCVLCVSVLKVLSKTTTETQRTQRLHREEQFKKVTKK